MSCTEMQNCSQKFFLYYRERLTVQAWVASWTFYLPWLEMGLATWSFLDLELTIESSLVHSGLVMHDKTYIANKQLTLLWAKLESISSAVGDLVDSEEDLSCTLKEYKEQVTQIKTALTTLNASLLVV